jgi:hypothetical protein
VQVVVLGQVLAADINIGYEEMVNTRVRAINGAEVRNLAGLVAAAEACAERFIQLDLDYSQVRLAMCSRPRSVFSSTAPVAAAAGGRCHACMTPAALAWHLALCRARHAVHASAALLPSQHISTILIVMCAGCFIVPQIVILETEAARAATKDILTQHYIAHDRSEELRSSSSGEKEKAG